MNTNNQPCVSHGEHTLEKDLRGIPALLDANGVRKHIMEISTTTLYELATRGEIESVSVGMKRGRRMFVTSTIAEWLKRRSANTKKPNLGKRVHQKKSAVGAAKEVAA